MADETARERAQGGGDGGDVEGEVGGGGSGGAEGGEGVSARLRELANLQLRLIAHALSFPRVRSIVYSTCSVHPIENELIVAAALALPRARAAGWRLARAIDDWPCAGLPLGAGAGACARSGPEWLTHGFFVARFIRSSTSDAPRAA